ncbi:MAG: 4Fe-4S dicluster domain-containing protein [Dehalococcoidia bacterium]|nr:4Fe-4S dicluster domain-containing protein [Dehalococcoidia bacterium]
MSRKILSTDLDKCGGCRTCELICSWSHDKGTIRPSVARIHVFKEESLGINIPMFCQQCEKAPCMEACPVNAIYRDFGTSATIINHEMCIGCKACMIVCPYGAIGFDSDKHQLLKCDLCQGDPQCVKWCPREALRYETAEISNLMRQRTIMEQRVAKPIIDAARAQGTGQPLMSVYSVPSSDQKH